MDAPDTVTGWRPPERFAYQEEWATATDGMATGWTPFLDNLRLYLTHFRGRPSAAVSLAGGSPDPKATAWTAMLDALGLSPDPQTLAAHQAEVWGAWIHQHFPSQPTTTDAHSS